MIVARPVYDLHFRKLLGEGAKLHAEAIRRIREEGFNDILIQEQGTEQINVADLVGVKVRQQVSGALEMFAAWQRKDLRDSEDLPCTQGSKGRCAFGCRGAAGG